MENLSPEDIRYLNSTPPYCPDFEDIVEKHFGDVPPENIWSVISDVQFLERNYAAVRRKNEEYAADDSLLPLSIHITKKLAVILNCIEELIVRVNDDFVRDRWVSSWSSGSKRKRGPNLYEKSSAAPMLGILHELKLGVNIMFESFKTEAASALGHDVVDEK